MVLLTYSATIAPRFAQLSRSRHGPGRWSEMKSTRGDKRFWASTRGRIILLLRRGSRSVNELAATLKLTDNAVRTHLTALERDGLVQASGTRPGTRRPTIMYELTPDAEYLF